MTGIIFQRRAKNVCIRKLILYTRKAKQRLCTNRIPLKHWRSNFCNVALPAGASLNYIQGTSRSEIVHQWNRSRLPLFSLHCWRFLWVRDCFRSSNDHVEFQIKVELGQSKGPGKRPRKEKRKKRNSFSSSPPPPPPPPLPCLLLSRQRLRRPKDCYIFVLWENQNSGHGNTNINKQLPPSLKKNNNK